MLDNLETARARIAKALALQHTKLDLSGLQLQELPLEFQQVAPQIRHLDISRNSLSIIPYQLSLCRDLEVLDLSENKLRTAGGMGAFPRLNGLNLSQNEFYDFPNEVLEYPQLQYLSLSENPLPRLPEGIRLLKNLSLLDLKNCKIEMLPPEITFLPHLKDLMLDANPLRTPPIEIAQRGIQAIRNYFQDLNQENTTEKGAKYLFAIAIERYKNTYDPRVAAEKETRELMDLLAEKCGFMEQMLLVNEAATASAIREKLSHFVRELKPQDTLILYFNGWTGDARAESDLITYDPEYLPFEQLGSSIASIRARHLLLMVDNHFQSRRISSTLRGISGDRETLSSRTVFYRSGADYEARFTPQLTKILRETTLSEISPEDFTYLIANTQFGILNTFGDQGGRFVFQIISPKAAETAAPEEKTGGVDGYAIKRLLDQIEWYRLELNKVITVEKANEYRKTIDALTLELNALQNFQNVNTPDKEAEWLETVSWNGATNSNTIEAYEQYLNAYPQALFLSEARRRIEDLRLLERETEILQSIRQSKAYSEMQSYLQTFPAGHYREEIQQMVTDIEAEEDLAWGKIQTENNPQVYRDFAATQQSNRYLERINARIAEIESTAGKLVSEAKLILVGNGRVGKTSLSKVLSGQAFNPQEDSTHGVRIEPWHIKSNDNQELTLNIWDFGGQEIYHNTHSFFLTKRALYLLVWNKEQSAAATKAPLQHQQRNFQHEYWLDLIRVRSEGSPVLMVQNIFKKQRAPIDETRFAGQTFNVLDFCEIDVASSTEQELQQVRDKILSQYREAPSLREIIPFRLPLQWVNARETLENTGKKDPYITYDVFRKICDEHQITDARAFGQYLNDVGVLLFFPDAKLPLRNIVILNPIWATGIIYRILNQKVQDAGGQFSEADLRSHWSETIETAFAPSFRFRDDEEVEIFLALMRTFDVCFELPDQAGQYIAPQFLPTQKPDFKWDSKNALRYGFQYEFLPRQVIARAIARMGKHGQNGLWWRDGILIDRKNTKAKIETDGERLLWIEIYGEDPERMEDWIDDHFSALNEKLPFKNVVFCPSCSSLIDRSKAENRRKKKELKITCDICEQDVAIAQIFQTGNSNNMKKPKIFLSYSHNDESYKEQLFKSLRQLRWKDEINIWDDRQIPAGADWKAEIDSNLNSADIIVLLVSSDFLVSDFIEKIELKRAMEREAAGDTLVIPVIIRPCLWKDSPVADFQVLPKDGKPVSKLDPDEAWLEVTEKIKERLKTIFDWGK